MRTRGRPGRLALVAGMVLALVLALLSTVPSQAASGTSLTVNLASPRGPSTGVGEGFLYGISEDGSQPADQFLQPLGINAFRGGGWFSGGWIRDGYQYGSATRADIDSITAQAKRLTRPPYHAQYQVLVSDIYGANGGQPSNTTYPCDNGNCSNWINFIDSTVGALQASGLTFSYDIWNEPDISVFWTRGVNSAQYFQMWDTAYREIRRIAPGAQIVGPSLAFTPQRNPGGRERLRRLDHRAVHVPGLARRVRRLSGTGLVRRRGLPGRQSATRRGRQQPVPGRVRQLRQRRRRDRPVDLQRAGQPAVPVRAGLGRLRRTAGPELRPGRGGRRQLHGGRHPGHRPAGPRHSGMWLPVRQSDGSYAFQNRNSGLCLDVYGAGSNAGQQLDQWQCKNAPGTNQDFVVR